MCMCMLFRIYLLNNYSLCCIDFSYNMREKAVTYLSLFLIQLEAKLNVYIFFKRERENIEIKVYFYCSLFFVSRLYKYLF